MDFIKIDGVAVKAPDTYQITRADLDSDKSKRNQTGYLQRSRIRAGMYTISISWSGTVEEIAAIANALSPESISVSDFRFHEWSVGYADYVRRRPNRRTKAILAKR